MSSILPVSYQCLFYILISLFVFFRHLIVWLICYLIQWFFFIPNNIYMQLYNTTQRHAILMSRCFYVLMNDIYTYIHPHIHTYIHTYPHTHVHKIDTHVFYIGLASSIIVNVFVFVRVVCIFQSFQEPHPNL